MGGAKPRERWVWAAIALAGTLGAWVCVDAIGELTPATTALQHAPFLTYAVWPAAGLMWSAVRRQPRSTALYATATVAAIAFANPNFAKPLAAEGPTIRVATLNAFNGRLGDAALASCLREFDPDVVLLQETSLLRDKPDRLAAILPDYRVFYLDNIALASRLPVRSLRHIDLGRAWAHQAEEFAWEVPHHQYVQAAELEYVGTSILVLNTHLSPDAYVPRIGEPMLKRGPLLAAKTRYRRAVQELMLDLVRRHHGPAVLGGDLNTMARGHLYRGFASELHDTWREAGIGFGYTLFARWPFTRCDYIWQRGLRTVEARVGSQLGSDHRLYCATLELATNR